MLFHIKNLYLKKLAICLILAAVPSMALTQDIPSLAAPSSLSGQPTTAQFKAGASSNTSLFSESFGSGEKIYLTASVSPESGHIGTGATVYVLTIVGGKAFALSENGQWIDFDGSVAGLGNALTVESLESANELSIVNISELHTRPGVVASNETVDYNVFLAYSTNANLGELYFSGVPLSFSVSTHDTQTVTGRELFESSVSQPIVQSRCVNCHVGGGIAGNTSLVFERSSANSIASNFQVFDTFASSRSDALEYLLAKASGNLAHGGGTQLAAGTTDYSNLESFINVLVNGGEIDSGPTAVEFFTGVELLGPAKTLRRASILLAGRAPSAVESSAVTNGDYSTLKTAIRSLMKGDNFHEFLLEGANDRLLVRGTQDGNILNGGGIYPNFRSRQVELTLSDRAKGLNWSFERGRFIQGVDRGLKDSPLELIAHVVENERPYSEILTADYVMLNSIAAFAMDATGSFPNPEDYSNFQPVTLDRYYTWSKEYEEEFIDEIQDKLVVNPGTSVYQFPHAGILNTQSYLYRYPTTATNRNRARSRWTFLHFLDTDIEASAPRSTDPVALADTNNPTMFNSNCTVCHSTLDPMAGAFQNYGENGTFRINGPDSLDNFYKFPEDGDGSYQIGDTWYRDMRTPGLFGQKAPSQENSLQWVAQHIAEDPRFAKAAVKFWWPSIIGAELLSQPEVQTDANYQAKLMAFDAQSQTIQSLADGFMASGMNLKDLLVEMTLTPWFRASRVDFSVLDPVEAEAHLLANLGSERLLTPEQLSRKTTSLTGYTLGNFFNFEQDRRESELVKEYSAYYGGIDSFSVTKRSREMTALMSKVAVSHASMSSCPIVVREFALPDGDRALFNDIDEFISPVSEGSETFTVETTFDRSFIQRSTTVSLDTSAKDLFVTINGNFCDYNEAKKTCDSGNHLEVDHLQVLLPNGVTTTIEATPQNVELPPSCAWYAGSDNVGMCNANKLVFPFSPPIAGGYKITASVWPTKYGSDDPRVRELSISVGVDSDVAAIDSTATGAQKIKQKLVELHSKLHGKTYEINSEEITLAYQLYSESWEETKNLPNSGEYSNVTWGKDLTCQIWTDYELGVGTSSDIEPYYIRYDDWGQGPRPSLVQTPEMDEFLRRAATDPLFTKRAWVTVLIYMLSHYNYLYE